MNLLLQEIGTTQNSTGSHLLIDGRPFCFTVEDGYRDKKIKHETRIPAGKYLGTDSTSVYKLLYSLAEKALERGEEIWIEIQRKPIPTTV